jgi:PPOX class probable FMN-dependent enzyme
VSVAPAPLPADAGIATADALRDLYPPATIRSSRKELDHLDRHCVRFVELSPFCVLATVGADGTPDMSPRGGDPGFVRVLDRSTAVLADRPGNYRIDSLTNVVGDPRVSLIFFVPGIDETLRVYGRASVVPIDPAMRAALDIDDKGRTALRIVVTRAYFHCAKAVMRSRLWDREAQVDRGCFPTMGELMNEHARLSTPVESQEEMLRRYEPTL